MAIAIKHIPVLKKEASVSFEAKATENIALRETIDFKKELSISKAILKKAKL